MFIRKAVRLIRNVIVGGADKSYQTCYFECDSASDLPAQNQSDYVIDIGSEAHDIDQNATYMMKSNGTWTLQEAGTAAYTKAETDALLADKADASSVYTKTQTDNLLAAKADASSVYTKTQTDNLLAAKADASSVYTKTQTDNLLAQKVGIYDVFGMGINIADITPTVTSLDQITTPGKYYVATGTAAQAVNAPYTRAGFGLLVIANSNNTRQTQILLPNPYSSDTTTIGWILFRQNLAGTYDTNWYKISGTPV